jgi:hypothetical protein
MKRHVFNLLTALSLLLFLAVCVMWVRSYFEGEVFNLPPGGVVDTTASAPMQGGTLTWRRQYSVHSGAGRLQLVRQEMQDTRVSKPGRIVLAPGEAVIELSTMGLGDVSYRGAGFGYFRRDKQPYSRPPVSGWYWGFLVVSVPYWAVVLAAAVMPLLWWRSFVQRRRRLRRERAQLCPACGYDLRATPGRCPECGWGALSEPST